MNTNELIGAMVQGLRVLVAVHTHDQARNELNMLAEHTKNLGTITDIQSMRLMHDSGGYVQFISLTVGDERITGLEFDIGFGPLTPLMVSRIRPRGTLGNTTDHQA